VKDLRGIEVFSTARFELAAAAKGTVQNKGRAEI